MNTNVTVIAVVAIAAAVAVTAMYFADRRREPMPASYGAPAAWTPEYGAGGRADAIYMNGQPVWSRS